MKKIAYVWKALLLSVLVALSACGGGGGGGRDDSDDGWQEDRGSDGGNNGGGAGGNNSGPAVYEEFGQGQVGNRWLKQLSVEGASIEVADLAMDWDDSLYLAGVMNKADGWHFFLSKYDKSETNLFLKSIAHDPTVKPRVVGIAEFSGEIFLLASWPDGDNHRSKIMVFDANSGELDREFAVSFGTKKFYAEDIAAGLFDVWVVGAVYDDDLDSAQYLAAKYKSQTGALVYTVTGDSSIGPRQPGRSHAKAIALSYHGPAFIVGETQGSLHGQPMSGTYRGVPATDGFLVKIQDSGHGQANHSIAFTKQFGAEVGNVHPKDVAHDASSEAKYYGRTVIVGEVEGRFMYSNQHGDVDGFLIAFDEEYGGTDAFQSLLPSQFGSPGARTEVNRVALRRNEYIYLAGHTTGNVASTNRSAVGHVDAFLMQFGLPDGYRYGIKQIGKPGTYNYNTALAVTTYPSIFDPSAIYQAINATGENGSNPEQILRRDNGKWGPEPKPNNPGGGGNSGGGNTGGGNSGGGSNLDWKNDWFYVQSDKALQFRLAKVREDGPHTVFRVQYRVNTSSNVYTTTSQGYHVYHHTDSGVKYRVSFPSNHTNKIWELPIEIKIAVGGLVQFDPSTNHISGYGSSYNWCVDANSVTSRCESKFGWKQSDMSYRYTAN